MQTRYYYRGTTRGWAGNLALREAKITCVTTDPLVATLFAIECRNHGQAAVVIAARADFELAKANFFAEEESAVNLSVSALEFEDCAALIIDVDRAIAILEELGYRSIPIRLANAGHLQVEIMASSSGMRLSLTQIWEFDRKLGLEGEGG